MILGGGYLQPTGKRNARLRLEHQAGHKDYLLWKAKLLPQFFQGKPTMMRRVHPLTKRAYSYVRHQSNASPLLGKFRQWFYPEGVKHIPENLARFLRDEIAFAIWFYDNGHYYERDRCSYLYLGRISEEEAARARDAIMEKFHIASKVLDKGKKGRVLYFPHAESGKIQTILKQYYVPVMAYKIPS